MNGIVNISEKVFSAFNCEISTVITYAQDTCPGLLVITEIFAWDPNHGGNKFHSCSQSFLPDGYIDHDEDDAPFIRSRRESQTERAIKAQQ